MGLGDFIEELQNRGYLERDEESTDEQKLGQYHYPSIIQAADGTLHATYSYFAPPASVNPKAPPRYGKSALSVSTKP